MRYAPKAKVLQACRLIRDAGESVPTATIADALCMSLSNVYYILQRPVDERMLTRVKRGTVCYYGLGKVPFEDPTDPAEGPARGLRVSLWTGGGIVVDGGQVQSLNEAQRAIVVEAIDKVRALA